MDKLQFRVLYRQFLFRMADLEALSAHAQGDLNKLLGQFAALLIFASMVLAIAAMSFAGSRPPVTERLGVTIVSEHFLIATTMLVVGLLRGAVLGLDVSGPPRRAGAGAAARSARARFSREGGGGRHGAGVDGRTAARARGRRVAARVRQAGDRAGRARAHVRCGDAAGRGVGDEGRAGSRHGAGAADGAVRAGNGRGSDDRSREARRAARVRVRDGEARFDLSRSARSARRSRAWCWRKWWRRARRGSTSRCGSCCLQERVKRPDGREITLLDLATHHSGLPGMPDNLEVTDRANPYADYHAGHLFRYLEKHGVSRPANTTFHYSNLGVGLLGVALANRAGVSYEQLLQDQVTGPLGLRDTVVSLSPEQEPRFIQGYSARHEPVPAWDMDVLAPAGRNPVDRGRPAHVSRGAIASGAARRDARGGDPQFA